MPSGAKRRKAAKKKKEQEQEQEQETPCGSEATSFNGGDELKGQESDGGEVSSPASQDPIHSGGHSFTEEGGDGESSPVREIVTEKGGIVEEVGAEEVGIVKVEEDVEITREFKSDEVLESRDLTVEVRDMAEGSSNGSSSSSSSDDEKVHIEKADEVVLNSAEAEEVYEVKGTPEDSPVPAVVIEDVVYVSEASPIEETFEYLDKPAVPEPYSEIKAFTDDALLLASESHGESSNVGLYHVNDAEDKELPPSDSTSAVTRNGLGNLKDDEIHYSYDNQTPIPQAPLSVQRTSWKGCCGLFDVFTGSR